MKKIIALLVCMMIFPVTHAQIKGVGASFPASVYISWVFAYSKETKLPASYSVSNSSDGMKQIEARDVDFGASDLPMSQDDLKKKNLMQFPTMVGGIVPVFNVKGIPPGKLKLTGVVLADIFLGNITSWDDERIAQINPGLPLPNLKIKRIAREDNSGSTLVFAKYLSNVSPEWEKSMGYGLKVTWSDSVKLASGSDGIVERIKSIQGSISYVSYDRVIKNDLSFAVLKNSSGVFIAPSEHSFAAAIKASAMIRGEESASLINLNGTNVWPITDATYILLDRAPKTATKINPVAKFFYWTFLKGDEMLGGTGFAPLPSEIQARIVRRLAEIRPVDGSSIELMQSDSSSSVLALSGFSESE
jgi:phosphate transport system substrate-binding protein